MINSNKYWADKCKIRNSMRKAVEQWDKRYWDTEEPNVKDITIKIDEFGKCVKISDEFDTIIVCYEDEKETTSAKEAVEKSTQASILRLERNIEFLREDVERLRRRVDFKELDK